ncbi:MAG TPA: alpha-glucan family phosphorylase [Kofleriaceae bacterium]|nr:alpha-glucan family phosphorylase [Kofleriaceae bacterium]
MARKQVREDERRIAYFTMEIAIDPAVPTYSGGLGVLAGDTIKSAADLGVAMVAVTLLQRRGYFVQSLDPVDGQREAPAVWQPEDQLAPLEPTVHVSIDGRPVEVRAWLREVVGHDGFTVPVLFLDTDLPANAAPDRALCGALYGGDERYRLSQELVLGVGGARMLDRLGYRGVRRYHLNEGHAALVTLELARRHNVERPVDDWEFDDVRATCVFTTHTPVPAGHDQFARQLVDEVVGDLVPRAILDRVAGPERLNMTALSLGLSGYVNGVARRHAEVSREMFPGYGIHHVTNGVHSRTWTAPDLAQLYDEHLPGWATDPFLLRNAARIPNDALWPAHARAKAALLAEVRARTGQALDPEALTIGFARRATPYKRADLVFSDLDRLRQVARESGPIQLVFAGKAHPRDEGGKALIRRILAVAGELGPEVPVVYLADYDLALGRTLVAGVDLWLNTPERPLEASGTSGMKAAHNGVPSLSCLDGWWVEGHVEGVTGWSIGPATTLPAGEAAGVDADDLYRKLASVIAPLYHRRREEWIAVMKNAIALNASFFNTHRMVQQYATDAYL